MVDIPLIVNKDTDSTRATKLEVFGISNDVLLKLKGYSTQTAHVISYIDNSGNVLIKMTDETAGLTGGSVYLYNPTGSPPFNNYVKFGASVSGLGMYQGSTDILKTTMNAHFGCSLGNDMVFSWTNEASAAGLSDTLLYRVGTRNLGLKDENGAGAKFTLGKLVFTGTTSGTITIQPASAAGTYTLTLPTTDGDSGDVLTSNGSGVTSFASLASLGVTAPPRTLVDHFGQVDNSGTSETDLFSYTIPANTMANDGDKVYFNYTIMFSSSATATRQVRVYYAGNTVFDSGSLTTASQSNMIVEGYIVRRDYQHVFFSSYVHSPLSTIFIAPQLSEYSSQDYTSSQIFKLTGQAGGTGGGSDQVLAQNGYLLYIPGAPV